MYVYMYVYNSRQFPRSVAESLSLVCPSMTHRARFEPYGMNFLACHVTVSDKQSHKPQQNCSKPTNLFH
jgi:hypothetical protein